MTPHDPPDGDWAVIEDEGGENDRDRDRDRDEVPGEDEDEVPDEVRDVLYLIQDALLRHPMVMQAAFSALVLEGRRFAATEEGAALRQRLLRSPSTASARMIWELLSGNAFTEHPTTLLPSVFLERLVRAVATRGLEPLISRLFERRAP